MNFRLNCAFPISFSKQTLNVGHFQKVSYSISTSSETKYTLRPEKKIDSISWSHCKTIYKCRFYVKHFVNEVCSSCGLNNLVLVSDYDAGMLSF